MRIDPLRLARWALPFLTVLLVGAAVRLVLPRFDGLYGQDPFGYFNYARGPLAAALSAGELPPPFFWPPGFPLLMWLLFPLTGPVPRAGQIVALSAGALLPLLTAALAGETRRALVGGQVEEGRRLAWLPLVAGLLVLFNPQLWQSSIVVMADTPALAAATAGLWLLARWGRTDRTRDLLLATAAIALALLIRWAYALVAVVATVYVLGRLARMTQQGQGAAALRRAGAAALVALVMLSPMGLPLLRDLLFGPAGGEASLARNLEFHSWNPMNAARREFLTADGLLRYRWPNGLYYLLAPARRYYFTALLAPFVGVGLVRLLRPRRWGIGWLVAGWAGMVLAFHVGSPIQNFRYTLAFLPPLAILLALGVTTTAGGLGRRWRPGSWLVALVVMAGLLGMSRGGIELSRFFVERHVDDLALVAWVEAQVPEGARLLAFNQFFVLDAYGPYETEHLFFLTPARAEAMLADGRPTYLLVEVDSMEGQWRDEPAGATYRWLRDVAGLTLMGERGSTSLYLIGE